MPVQNHLFIVITGDNGNALGIIRALGEAGVKPILIYLIEATRHPMLIHSRYLTVVHKVQSYEEGLEILLENARGVIHRTAVQAGERQDGRVAGGDA